MSVILNIINTAVGNLDLIILCGAAGLFGYYYIPNLIKQFNKDGIQVSDPIDAAILTTVDYKTAVSELESHIAGSIDIIDDVTINDEDTVANVKSILETAKSVITGLKQLK